MTYYEQLKKAVADAVEKASDKETVDRMASIQAAMEGLEQEQSDLVKKNHELLVAYKEAIAHPGVTKDPAPNATDIPESGPADFAEFLQAKLNA